MSLLPKLNALWRVPVILLLTAVLASLSVLSSVFDSSGCLQHWWARTWGKLILWISRVRVHVKGSENLVPGRGYVFMANHLSMFDHWAFLAKLPCQFRFAAKSSLFKIPFLGWHLRRSGNIPVHYTNPRRTLKEFRAFGRKIGEGVSLVIYPEGGRTWGEALAPFKRGAFLLAKHASAPIIPVTFIGAHRRLERGSAIIYPGEMEMIIHPVISFEDYREDDLQAISDRVRQIIEEDYRQVPT